MTLDKAIERYTSNAEYERTHGNLQGCLDFRQLAEWLKDYKRLKEQEPCEDVIRREDAINAVSEALEHVVVEHDDVAKKMINKLPSVKPQEPKTGHWIEHPHEAGPCWEYSRYECSECHEWAEDDSDYCPSCGAKMQEVEDGNK